MALFVSSNTGIGAAVMIQLRGGGNTLAIPPLFKFTLSNSVKDMWNAGLYPLSMLICGFSGVWPYVKLAMILVCWVTPLKALNARIRENILMFLDALGKYSLIDAYVLVLMMVAFRFTIKPPTSWVPLDVPNPGLIDVFCQPMWGIYSFIIATIISLVITHVALFYHRLQQRRDEHSGIMGGDRKS
eukprot:350666_1